MSTSLPAFIRLSSLLTGYSQLQLGATAVASTYQNLLKSVLPPQVFTLLMGKADALPQEDDEAEREIAGLLEDPALGPVLKNIILVWYTGTWNALSGDWQESLGALAQDRTHVVSTSAYQGGLQWLAAGGHASGANHQGFGAWSSQPAGTGV